VPNHGALFKSLLMAHLSGNADSNSTKALSLQNKRFSPGPRAEYL
jgi:hypothetical protein